LSKLNSGKVGQRGKQANLKFMLAEYQFNKLKALRREGFFILLSVSSYQIPCCSGSYRQTKCYCQNIIIPPSPDNKIKSAQKIVRHYLSNKEI